MAAVELTRSDLDEKLLGRRRVSAGAVLVDGGDAELEPPSWRVQLSELFPCPVRPGHHSPRGHAFRYERGAHVVPFLDHVRHVTCRCARERRRPLDRQRLTVVRHSDDVRHVR